MASSLSTICPSRFLLLFLCALFLPGPSAHAQFWTSLGQGASDPVSSLVVDDNAGILYAGGDFVMADGKTVNCIARWDGTSWDSLGPGANHTQGSCATDITAMAIYQGDLVIAGDLFSGGGNDIGRWNGSGWDTLLADPLQATIISLHAADADLYALGTFETIDGVNASLIAKWDGTSWSPIDTTQWDTGWRLVDMEFYQGDLYIAGNFENASLGIQNIARWDGTTWEAVGSGILGSTAWVNSLEIYQGKLIAGGLFNQGQGNPGNSIAAWDGASWSSLDEGVGGLSFPRVDDMVVHDGALFVSGLFLTAGGEPAQHIASWDGLRWCNSGDEIDNVVKTLAVYDNELILGGGFTTVDGNPENRIVSWTGGAFDQFCSEPEQVTGPHPQPEFDLRIWPNPSDGIVQLSVRGVGASPLSVRVVNVMGQTVLSEMVPAEQSHHALNLGALAPGTYWVEANSGNLHSNRVVLVN